MQSTVSFHLVEHDRGGERKGKKSQTRDYIRVRQEGDERHKVQKNLPFNSCLSPQVRQICSADFPSPTNINDFSFFSVSFLPFTLLWSKHTGQNLLRSVSLPAPNRSGHIPLCYSDELHQFRRGATYLCSNLFSGKD